KLLPQAEGCVHQAGRLLDFAVGEVTPAHGGSAEVQVSGPSFGQAVLQGEVALVDVNAVTLPACFDSDVMRVATGPDVVGFRFLVQRPNDKLAALRQVRPLRKRPMRNVLGSGRSLRRPG